MHPLTAVKGGRRDCENRDCGSFNTVRRPHLLKLVGRTLDLALELVAGRLVGDKDVAGVGRHSLCDGSKGEQSNKCEEKSRSTHGFTINASCKICLLPTELKI